MKTGPRVDPIIDPILGVLTDKRSRRPIELADDVLRASGGVLRPEVRDIVKVLAILQQRGLVRQAGKRGAYRLVDGQPF